MLDFSQQISEFKKDGEYTYNFDEGSNIVFDKNSTEFNNHYISIPLQNYGYNNTKIESFYNLEFQEFIPTKNVVQIVNPISTEVTQLTQENQQLKTKLDTLIETSNSNTTQAETLATKQVILSLRIQLKQGNIEKDFSDTFPYLPITKK